MASAGWKGSGAAITTASSRQAKQAFDVAVQLRDRVARAERRPHFRRRVGERDEVEPLALLPQIEGVLALPDEPGPDQSDAQPLHRFPRLERSNRRNTAHSPKVASSARFEVVAPRTAAAEWLKQRRIKAVIPSTASRTTPYPIDRKAYRRRNVIERLFCKLKNWRRTATRYNRLARNYMAALALAAIVSAWTV